METKKRTVEKQRKEAETEQLEHEEAKSGIEKSTKKYEKREPALKQVELFSWDFDSLPDGKMERSLRLPAKKKPSGEDVLALMRKLTENGIVECTSSLLRDKLNLDKESGRDQIRRLMRKLEKESKVIIGQKQQGKRKQYIFKLKEG